MDAHCAKYRASDLRCLVSLGVSTMTDQLLVNIRLQSLWNHGGCHPARMLGRFNDAGELIYAKAPDKGLSWERKPDESSEAFEDRICEAIMIARHLPPLYSRGGMERPTPKTESPLYKKDEPQHGGSKLTDADYVAPPRKRPPVRHLGPRKVAAEA